MSYDLMFNKANDLYEKACYDDAEKIYRSILEAVPENPDVLNMIGLTAQAKGLHKQAISYFSQAIKVSPTHLPLYFNLAFSYQHLEKYVQAIEAYNKVLELNPNIKETYNNLGNVYEQLKDKDKALQCYNKALLLDNDYVDALVNVAVLNNDLESLLNLDKKYPSSAIINYYIAKIYYEQNKIDEALRYIDTADAIDENSFEINLLKAKTNAKLNNIDSAVKCFYKTVKFNHKCIEAWLNLADIEENEEYYLKVLDLDPNNLSAHANYANLLYKQNRTLEALEEYRKAVIINPDLPELSNNLALILKDMGDYERSLDLMMNAFTKDKTNTEFSVNIAETLIMFYKSEPEKALNIAKKWVDLDANNVFAKHTLASFNNDSKNIDILYVKELFDKFASTYDETMEKIKYAVIKKVSELNIEFYGNVLDLGCGTGVFANCIKKDNIKQLIGVDISQNMLNLAEKKRVYTNLFNKDAYTFLTENNIMFDFMVAFDVFEYISDIEKLFTKINAKTIIFNIETAKEDIIDTILTYNGRIKHNPEYIKQILATSGYTLTHEYHINLRQENDDIVAGVLFVATKNTF